MNSQSSNLVQAIVYREHGVPERVCRWEYREMKRLGEGEVAVQMVYAPINPADLNLIEGVYAYRLPLPAVAGGEGVGVVLAGEGSVGNLAPGTLVILPSRVGTWAEVLHVPEDQLVVVPEGIAPEQAAMLRVNPATALRMLSDFVRLEPGAWVIQNAANSGVGRAVIQIARERGWRTVNLVRRPELVEELRALGGDVVLLDDEHWPVSAEQALGESVLKLGLNSVGGESALRIAKRLGEGGTLVTYGAMGRQPLRVPNGLLIFRDLRLVGFWVTRWFEQASGEARQSLWAELFELAQRGVLHSAIERSYPLSQIGEALVRAQQGGRAGKVLLTP